MKKCLAILFVSALMLLDAFRSDAAFLGFEARSNEDLRGELLHVLRAAQRDLSPEPASFMIQELMLEIEAAALHDPYAWLDQTYEFCNVMENIYGPVIFHPGTQGMDRMQVLRSHILKILDYPYHEVSLKNAQATRDGDISHYKPEQARAFYDATYASNWQRRLNISEALKVELSEGECQLIKVYSSGYIFRTRDHCVAADLCYRRCFNTTDGIDEIADAIDILFTSHPHDDHYDVTLWRRMAASGKPMLFTRDIDPSTQGNKICWPCTPGKVDHELVPLSGGGETDVTAVHSRQGRAPLLMYLARTDGWSFLHIADSSEKETWKAFVSCGSEAPDFVFSPQDTPEALSVVDKMAGAGGRPHFYFTTHENEYEHSVSRRAAYSWLLSAPHCLGSLNFFSYPACIVLIDNGESLIFCRR